MRKLVVLLAGLLLSGIAQAQEKISYDYMATSGTNRTVSFTVVDKWIGITTLKIRASDSVTTNTATLYVIANSKTNVALTASFTDSYSFIPTEKFYFKNADLLVISNTQSNYLVELFFAKP